MDIEKKILRRVPLFRHCTDDEIESLYKIGRMSVIKKGQLFDLKKIHGFNIVIDGSFEIEALGKTDIVYLAPGSFFGNVPFTNNRLRGTIRAMVDSALLLFTLEEVYRFFLVSYKCLRGYLRAADRMGYEISDIGRRYIERNTRITAVYGMQRESGKSLAASVLGAALSGKGKTVILDLSYDGNSLFNFFQKKITSPVSQLMESGSAENLIHERVEQVTDELHLLNISHGSKVKVNGDILPPILFVLSQEYRHIVLDLSENDAELRNKSFSLSDTIICLLKSPKEKPDLYPVLDGNVLEGQRVYYLLNEHFSKNVRSFSGGFMLEDFSLTDGADADALRRFSESDSILRLIPLLTGRSRALVLETNFLESVFFGGFLSELRESGHGFSAYYTSSMSFIVLAMWQVFGSEPEFRKRLAGFFSEERINSFLDVTFPDGFIFKNHSISRYAEELFGGVRIEELASIPVAMLCESGSGRKRLHSTGPVKDIAAASFCISPLFESKDIAGIPYSSGYPLQRVNVEDLYRTGVDEILFASVDNAAKLQLADEKGLRFFRDFMHFTGEMRQDDKMSELADGNIVINVSEKELRAEKIFEFTKDRANKLLKEKRIMPYTGRSLEKERSG